MDQLCPLQSGLEQHACEGSNRKSQSNTVVFSCCFLSARDSTIISLRSLAVTTSGTTPFTFHVARTPQSPRHTAHCKPHTGSKSQDGFPQQSLRKGSVTAHTRIPTLHSTPQRGTPLPLPLHAQLLPYGPPPLTRRKDQGSVFQVLVRETGRASSRVRALLIMSRSGAAALYGRDGGRSLRLASQPRAGEGDGAASP